ncbi:MAG: translational GTPase TypA [Gammaproteobacteria bacterium]|nr:translational GTPase TypA [Gammaproteobacteria bacterium]
MTTPIAAPPEKLRNVAIVAHVDHGKTTLVDALLRQSDTLAERTQLADRAMDRNDLEKERGITILAKTTAVQWDGWRINIVDTPGHADFGGEVERVMSMVDAVLLLVDAVDGPMPQTRFVLSKAFAAGLRPIVVINKMDRDGARSDWVLDQTFDLMDRLGATEEQLDFATLYCSAVNGWASLEASVPGTDMRPLFETLVEQCPPPPVAPSATLQLQISLLDYSQYVGALAIGRITAGRVRVNQPVAVIDRDGAVRRERIVKVYRFHGLDRVEVDEVSAGDIVAVAGIERPQVSDTLCDPEHVRALPPLSVDEPTISMTFETNDSPFAGRDGKYVTSRQLRDRLMREAVHNVALRVGETEDPEKFLVEGRGELHLSVLLETMRREGYELAVSRPRVIERELDGELQEPYEQVTVDIDDTHQGGLMEALAERGGQLVNLVADGTGRIRLDYEMPARGLIGFQTRFRTLTAGSGLLYHSFERWGPKAKLKTRSRDRGVLIANGTGTTVGYALFNLQDRGRLFVGPGVEVYEGQIIGLHSRDNDLTVNPMKAKQLTNVRASGKDENVQLSPPQLVTLEQGLEFIEDDELMEITPQEIRLRKRHRLEHERKRASRAAG